MKRILIVLAVVLGILGITGCSSYSPDTDQTAVEQDGYVFIKTDKTLVGCHQPGQSGYGGVGNDMFYYPAGQRTYSFTGNSGSEEKPVSVVTSDGQTLEQPGFIKFTLTSNCKDLWDFHRKVGLKYHAYSEDSGKESSGWDNFLNDYLATALNSALNDATGSVGWRTLYQDASQRTKIESGLTKVVQDRVNESLGSSEWIKVTGVTLAKPVAPAGLVEGLQAAQSADLKNAAQKRLNQVNRTKYDSMKDCRAAGISEQSCLTIYLADNDKIPFYPVTQGGAINVNPR